MSIKDPIKVSTFCKSISTAIPYIATNTRVQIKHTGTMTGLVSEVNVFWYRIGFGTLVTVSVS